MKNSLLLILSLCGLCLLDGCGGGNSALPPPPAITVDLSPNSAQALDMNQSDTFTATVNNDSSNQGVNWTVACPSGVTTCGAMAQTRTASGAQNRYSAPANVSAPETVTLTATSVSDPTKSKSIQVTVSPALALINPPPAQPQPVTVGQAFSLNLMNFVQGGTQPLNWVNKSGTLPAGLQLTPSTGMVTGTPSGPGTAVVITFSCTDSGNPAVPLPAEIQISITINSASLKITSGDPPLGVVGRGYFGHCDPHFPFPVCVEASGFPLTASGGATPYSWSWAPAVGSSLPQGLGIDTRCDNIPGHGICGTPSLAGTYNVVVTIKDSGSPADQATAFYTIVVKNPLPPAIKSGLAPPAGALNLPYSFTFVASDGLAPLSWTETGALPSTLALSADGVLSGTPGGTGSYTITLTVTDALGRSSSSQDFTIQVFMHGFKAVGSMGTTRTRHTATLLSDGRVLVAGGSNISGDLMSAELFEPASESFTPTGSMSTVRQQHTATLLDHGSPATNGKVLVTGGSTATAELFDPLSGTFTPTGGMAALRRAHTATLLNSGKVLVTGGFGPSGALATAELFDPATGTFAPTGNMQVARASHTATLLDDGKVLLTGGVDPNVNSLTSAELFDPSSGTFAQTGSLGAARSQHTATLLNTGKVLVTGGLNLDQNGLASAELFDPATGSFTSQAR